jgi:hypothetical protein
LDRAVLTTFGKDKALKELEDGPNHSEEKEEVYLNLEIQAIT